MISLKPTLLLALGLVAAIGIVGGFLAFVAPPGGEPIGPLSGSIGTAQTCLTMTISPCSTPDASRYVQYTVYGYLNDQENKPLVNRTIQFSTISCTADGRCMQTNDPYDTAVTKSDGSYRRVRSEPRNLPWDPNANVRIRAQFYGDSVYAGSSAEAKKVC